MTARLITAPATEPLTLAEAKLHLRVDATDEDTMITSLISVARHECENRTGRALITQTWEVTLDCFEDSMELPHPPLQTVSSVKYLDEDEVEQTLGTTVYRVDGYAEPARVTRTYGETWPDVALDYPNAVRIRYVAGYGDDATDVPPPLKQWMLLHIGHWYANREASAKDLRTLPMLDGLLDPYRVVPV
jgi:uncharacterized phiE125 gp8 family phage protein